MHVDLLGVVTVHLGADRALVSLLDRGLVDVQPLGRNHALVFLTESGQEVAAILRRARKRPP